MKVGVLTLGKGRPWRRGCCL